MLGQPLRRLLKLAHTLIAVLGLFVIAVAAIYFLRRPASKEPIFAGRSLSEWCLDFDPGRPKRLTEAAETALRSIGTNALPILIARATHRDEDFNQQLRDASFRYRWFRRGRFPGEFWDGVFGAFRALGPEAAGAIPALTECLTNSLWPGPAMTSALALGAIGSSALPSLMSALNCPAESARMAALSGFSEMGTNAKVAIPKLIQMLNETNLWWKDQITNALIAIDPQGGRPILVNPPSTSAVPE